jgi:hypothetical protein
MVQVTSERNGAAAAAAQFRNDMTVLRTKIETLRGERDRFVSWHADRPTAGKLQEALDEAVAGRERSTQALAAGKLEFVDLGGAEIQADARRLGIAADSLANRLRDVRSAGDQLQGELRTLMLAGHYESKEEAGAKVEQARADLLRLERQAAAARRLWEVLSAERRRMVEKLTAPVTLRVRPYLQDLFPGCSLDAGEALDVLGLRSDQLNEPFGELSGGAQEQVSLLTRIGLAEVLAADGTLPLVLDDALINKDSAAVVSRGGHPADHFIQLSRCVVRRPGRGIRLPIGPEASLMTPPARRGLLVGRSSAAYLAEATLPSEPLISSFSLVPSSLTTSILYCS